jgi:16S rRNA (cytosine1402-N4)-methyltransferase
MAGRWALIGQRVRAYQAEHNSGHVPVMLDDVLEHLSPRDGGVYVDGTFGTGGYSRALLEAADCIVYAIDRDPAAIARADAMTAEFGTRFRPLQGCFGDVETLLRQAGVTAVDGFVLDLGVSSPQLDQAERGFSFREDGPLDMRMSGTGESAADIVNTASEKELADIIFEYGEERAARRIARRIVAARAEAPLSTTRQLTALVHDVLPMHGGHKTDTATRTFQALRIAVNDELGELDRALAAAPAILREEGRLVVVSFHSLEDARVKRFLRRASGGEAAPSRHAPAAGNAGNAPPPLFTLPVGKAVAASAGEAAENPRARSAKLRVAIRTAAPLSSRAGGPHA